MFSALASLVYCVKRGGNRVLGAPNKALGLLRCCGFVNVPTIKNAGTYSAALAGEALQIPALPMAGGEEGSREVIGGQRLHPIPGEGGSFPGRVEIGIADIGVILIIGEITRDVQRIVFILGHL